MGLRSHVDYSAYALTWLPQKILRPRPQSALASDISALLGRSRVLQVSASSLRNSSSIVIVENPVVVPLMFGNITPQELYCCHSTMCHEALLQSWKLKR